MSPRNSLAGPGSINAGPSVFSSNLAQNSITGPGSLNAGPSVFGHLPQNGLTGPGSLEVGPSVFSGDLFDDDQRYYESVSVDLEQEEFNKLQYYKNIINTLIEKAEESKKKPAKTKYQDGIVFPQTTSKKERSNKKFIQNEFLKEYPTNII